MKELKKIAVLFARDDSIYKSMSGVDVFDRHRDARTYSGSAPVVAHPPCRAWGRLRGLSNPRADEKNLALFAVDVVRRFGGVLEHPSSSTLWPVAGLPAPGARDEYGGWTLPVYQSSFGHKAQKSTLLYIVGVEPAHIPMMPLALGHASHVVGSSGRRLDGGRLHKGDRGWRPEVTKMEREATPPAFAVWLVELASRVILERAA